MSAMKDYHLFSIYCSPPQQVRITREAVTQHFPRRLFLAKCISTVLTPGAVTMWGLGGTSCACICIPCTEVAEFIGTTRIIVTSDRAQPTPMLRAPNRFVSANTPLSRLIRVMLLPWLHRTERTVWGRQQCMAKRQLPVASRKIHLRQQTAPVE